MVQRAWKSPRPKVTPGSSWSPWMIPSRKRTNKPLILRLWIGITTIWKGRKATPFTRGDGFHVVHVLVGSVHLVFDISIYLRKTIRRLNRRRPKEKRLRFGSKYRLVRRALEALKPLLPPGWAVYILCDRWYTSRRLINYCRRQGWHFREPIKANRKLDGVRVDQKERKHLRRGGTSE